MEGTPIINQFLDATLDIVFENEALRSRVQELELFAAIEMANGYKRYELGDKLSKRLLENAITGNVVYISEMDNLTEEERKVVKDGFGLDFLDLL